MSNPKPRTGPLSTEEKKYIAENCSFVPSNELAEKMGRTLQIVQNYIQQARLRSYDDEPQDRDRVRVRKVLEKKYWFPLIKKQLLRNQEIDELEIFINRWIDYYLQYKEDVVASEETQLNEIILLNIQLERIRQAEVETRQKIKTLEFKIEDEYYKDEALRDLQNLARWESQLNIAKTTLQSHASQIKSINDNLQKLYDAMKSTRDKRFTKVESGKNTFASIIRRLQEDEYRLSKSREAELIRMATDKKREALEDYHQYEDGSLDCPILNHQSAQKIIADENQSEER